MEVEELVFEEAVEFAKQNKTSLVWIGSEPKEYISELLNIEDGLLKHLQPNEILKLDKDSAKKYEKHVFVCYHGNSSRYVANFLKEKHGVESISMKGGVTSVVGEIF
ncbi:MAG: rhodanese-like domain-containing protein [Candidatus Micrarchaeia archaeon]